MNISAATQLALKLSANIDLDHQIISDVDQLSFTTDKDVAYDLVKSRLLEGKGEVLLDIGVNNEGESLCLDQLKFQNYLNLLTLTADQLNADLSVVYKRSCVKFGSSSNVSNSDGFYYAHCLIRQRCNGKVEDIIEARVAVVGNVDAGKSTLLGVLTKDLLDDGRGKARVNLFTHKHELETGRTSSVGTEIMGFDSKGTIITPRLLNKSKINWEDVCYASSKVISFIDLAGHEKYLRTTAFGMTGHAPDYAILMIGANSGVIGMTREHLGLALALNVPVMIVITKIDMCPANILEATITQLSKILRSNGCKKIPLFVNNIEDVMVGSGSFISERICPIFQVSNVSGKNLDLLKLFLNLLPSNANDKYKTSTAVEYQITDTFSVPGVGTVVNGTVLSGIVHVGDSLLLGPDLQGVFTPTIVKSIQRKRINVPCARAGQTATFALKKTKRSSIRKGMVLLGKTLQPPVATFEFEAEVLVLYHSSTINTKYQTMLHVGSVRQTAQIVGMDRVVLRTGDRAIVRFRFIMNPEYVKLGTRLIFREGRCKGIEKIVRLLTQEEPLLLPENISNAERESLSRAAELSVYENGRMIRKGKKRTVRKM